jgi:hypothetical protein
VSPLPGGRIAKTAHEGEEILALVHIAMKETMSEIKKDIWRYAAACLFALVANCFVQLKSGSWMSWEALVIIVTIIVWSNQQKEKGK